MNKECDDLFQSLCAYADGELAGQERTRVETHLAKCPECRRTFDEMSAVTTMLKTAWSELDEPGDEALPQWEDIEMKIHSGTVWTRILDKISKPFVWVPFTAAVAAAAVLMVVFLPRPGTQQVMQVSSVESVYSESGNVIMMQTAQTGQPLIWILPESQEEAKS